MMKEVKELWHSLWHAKLKIPSIGRGNLINYFFFSR